MLREFRDLHPGSVLNRDLLDRGLSHVESLYKSRGYIYWFADPPYSEVGNHKVDVDVKIFEGDKFFLGRLEVTGTRPPATRSSAGSSPSTRATS